MATLAHFNCLEMAKPVIDAAGTQRWFKGGELHRENGPAVIYKSCRHLIWCKYDKIHRDGDLPAVIDSDYQSWFKEGIAHRDGDMPAIVYADGSQEWYKEGKNHRDGDLPAVVYADGSQEWCKDDVYHREIGPAWIRLSQPPKFYERGKERSPIFTRGETAVGLAPASWSPVMCFM